MSRSLLRVGLVLAANAIGLIVAALVLDDMSLGTLPFFIALAVFSLVVLVSRPLLEKAAAKWADGLTALVSVVVVWLALLVADILSAGIDIEGFGTWVLATLIVWAVSMIGAVVLPKLFLKEPDRR